MQFTATEKHILRIVQSNLPDVPEPYAAIAKEVGCTEEDVLSLLLRLRDNGAIRRFGASIKHQKTAWKHNAMVAWRIAEELIDTCGECAAQHPNISHAYYRPSSAQDWPYTLYTMIHGRTWEECLDVITHLTQTTPLQEHAILTSLKEYKKISMTYF